MVTRSFGKTFLSLLSEYLIWHGPHRNHRVRQFFYYCVCICCRGKMFTEPFPDNGPLFWLYCPCLQALRGTHSKTSLIRSTNSKQLLQIFVMLFRRRRIFSPVGELFADSTLRNPLLVALLRKFFLLLLLLVLWHICSKQELWSQRNGCVTCKNRRAVEIGVFCEVCLEAIYRRPVAITEVLRRQLEEQEVGVSWPPACEDVSP
jgi:hypothetical protein